MEDELTGLNHPPRSPAEEAQSQTSAHLTPNQLVAYHFRQLSEDEAEQIQIHLVKCRECASLLLDLADFCAPGEDPASQLSPTEFEAAWAELRARLPLSPQPPRSLPSSEPSFYQRLRRLMFSFRPAYALATLSLVLSLALAAWVVSLNWEKQGLIAQLNQGQDGREALTKQIEETQRQGDEARKRVEQMKGELDKTRRERDELLKPQLNVPVVDLPRGETRAPGDPRPVIKPDAKGAFFTLLIPDPPEPHYPEYAIEILDQSRATVVNEKGLIRDPEGGFAILLPRHLFPPGEYRFNVYGLGRGGRRQVMGEVITIRYK